MIGDQIIAYMGIPADKLQQPHRVFGWKIDAKKGLTIQVKSGLRQETYTLRTSFKEIY